jgi:hypothetical protein
LGKASYGDFLKSSLIFRIVRNHSSIETPSAKEFDSSDGYFFKSQMVIQPLCTNEKNELFTYFW